MTSPNSFALFIIDALNNAPDGKELNLNLNTIFESSTMHINSFAAEATIFSLVCAPPPPLISSLLGATSSAPSI